MEGKDKKKKKITISRQGNRVARGCFGAKTPPLAARPSPSAAARPFACLSPSFTESRYVLSFHLQDTKKVWFRGQEGREAKTDETRHGFTCGALQGRLVSSQYRYEDHVPSLRFFCMVPSSLRLLVHLPCARVVRCGCRSASGVAPSALVLVPPMSPGVASTLSTCLEPCR